MFDRYHIVIQSKKGTLICDTQENRQGAFVIYRSLCNGFRTSLPSISMHEIGKNSDGSGYSKLVESRSYYRCPKTDRILCTTVR